MLPSGLRVSNWAEIPAVGTGVQWPGHGSLLTGRSRGEQGREASELKVGAQLELLLYYLPTCCTCNMQY